MPRVLGQLKTHELKAELGKRKLPTTGAKAVLEDRLREALQAAGHDTETFEFDYVDSTAMETYAVQSQGPSDGMLMFMQQLMAKMDDQTKKMDDQTKKIDDQAKQTKDFSEKLDALDNKIEEKLEKRLAAFNETLETKLVENTEAIENKLDVRIQSVCGEVDQLRKELENVKSTGVAKTEVTTRQNYKAPTFDGQTSWTIYKTQFEAAARNNQWTQHEKATALVLALRGNAAEVLQTIPMEQQSNLSELMQALDLRYGNDHMKQIYRTQLRNRVQKPGESLQQLQQDIERLALLSYPNSDAERQNETATEAFINAVQDRELQQALRLADKWTTKEALAYALTYEAAKQASRNAVRVRELSDECVCQRAEVTTEGGTRGAPRCWNCNRVGHLSRDCRKPRRRNYCQSCAARRGERELQQRASSPSNGAGNA